LCNKFAYCVQMRRTTDIVTPCIVIAIVRAGKGNNREANCSIDFEARGAS
jgi:hypothetical protein